MDLLVLCIKNKWLILRCKECTLTQWKLLTAMASRNYSYPNIFLAEMGNLTNCALYIECLKKLTLLNSLPNKTNIFRNFSYVWMAKGLIYHMTPTKKKI